MVIFFYNKNNDEVTGKPFKAYVDEETLNILNLTLYVTGVDVAELSQFKYLLIPKFNLHYRIKRLSVDFDGTVSINARVKLCDNI